MSTLFGSVDPNVSWGLIGAQRIACTSDGSATNENQCYAISAGHPLHLRVESVGRLITSWRYFARKASDGTVVSSGQYIDSAGKESWRGKIDLPATEKETTEYELGLEITTDHGDRVERTMHITNIVRPATDTAWTVIGTAVRLKPSGCWVEKADPIVTLALEACGSTTDAIKAVVVAPDNLTLQQYVTNSIEAYSRKGIWKVDKRTDPPAPLDGERLVLTQTIGADRRLIAKYFIPYEHRIVIISRYFAPDQTSQLDDTSWIVVPKP